MQGRIGYQIRIGGGEVKEDEEGRRKDNSMSVGGGVSE